jgi:hypothetical protein
MELYIVVVYHGLTLAQLASYAGRVGCPNHRGSDSEQLDPRSSQGFQK